LLRRDAGRAAALPLAESDRNQASGAAANARQGALTAGVDRKLDSIPIAWPGSPLKAAFIDAIIAAGLRYGDMP
jgi:hypothetical protein